MAYKDQEEQKKRNLMFLLGMFLFIGGIGGGYYLLHSGQYNEQTPAPFDQAATLGPAPSASPTPSPCEAIKSKAGKKGAVVPIDKADDCPDAP